MRTLKEQECEGNRKEKSSEEQSWKQLLKWQFCKESKKDKSSEEHIFVQILG